MRKAIEHLFARGQHYAGRGQDSRCMSSFGDSGFLNLTWGKQGGQFSGITPKRVMPGYSQFGRLLGQRVSLDSGNSGLRNGPDFCQSTRTNRISRLRAGTFSLHITLCVSLRISNVFYIS
jgi:hypothetical protein